VTETLSMQIDADTKRRLHVLSKRSILTAEAIAAYIESQEGRLGELQADSLDYSLSEIARSVVES
jgi:predicted transcriptional regulator